MSMWVDPLPENNFVYQLNELISCPVCSWWREKAKSGERGGGERGREEEGGGGGGGGEGEEEKY